MLSKKKIIENQIIADFYSYFTDLGYIKSNVIDITDLVNILFMISRKAKKYRISQRRVKKLKDIALKKFSTNSLT